MTVPKPSAAEMIGRLPKWAQRYISDLQRQIKELRAHVDRDAEGSTIFLDPYRERIPLGDEFAAIHFEHSERDFIAVQWDFSQRPRKVLLIRGSEAIVIRPQSSNTVEVSLKDR